jgi:isoquinoline 1-oxidoreductase beta subunit
MNYVSRVNRRAFVVSAAAFGGALALGMDLPFSPGVVRAADGAPEVTAWVVIKPDDSIVIRVARSEMGQGTMTGLAQLVAEELECDWAKVSVEFPTPGENLARNRVWGINSRLEAVASASQTNTYAKPVRLRAAC